MKKTPAPSPFNVSTLIGISILILSITGLIAVCSGFEGKVSLKFGFAQVVIDGTRSIK